MGVSMLADGVSIDDLRVSYIHSPLCYSDPQLMLHQWNDDTSRRNGVETLTVGVHHVIETDSSDDSVSGELFPTS